MIKRLTKADDILQILSLDDNLEDIVDCTKAEFLQFLIRTLPENDKIFILGSFYNDKLTGYVIAVNTVTPPISKSVYVSQFFSIDSHDVNHEMIETIKNWARSLGAIRIDFATRDKVEHFKKHYGCVEKDVTEMELIL